MNKDLMGAWVLYTYEIRKDTTYINISKTIYKTDHNYLGALRKNPPKKAMLIGERWLPNGFTHIEYDSDYSSFDKQEVRIAQFQETDRTHCLLVVESPHKNPIRVDIKTTTLLDGTPIKDLL